MEENILKITNGEDVTKLNINDLDFGFGIGDYYYNGNETGGQIGFIWNEEKGFEYIDSLCLTIYIGNEEENDLMTLEKYLVNKTKDRKLIVTLSKEDYQIFLKWKTICDKEKFTYYDVSSCNDLI